MASSGQDPNTAAMELLLDDSQTGQNSEKIIRLGMQGLWRQPTDTAAQFGRFLEYILTTNCSADCYYRHQYSRESRACQSLRLCKTAVLDMTTATCMMADGWAEAYLRRQGGCEMLSRRLHSSTEAVTWNIQMPVRHPRGTAISYR